MYGAFAAVFMTLFGWGFAEIYFRNKPSSFYSFQESGKKEEEGLDIEDETDLPGTMASLLPLVVPILLILGKTTCDMLCPEGSLLLTVTSFIGDSNIALAIGAVLAMATLGKGLGSKKVLEIMDKTLKDAGPIVFITAAGGALGQVLKVSGAGDSLAAMVVNTGLPLLCLSVCIPGQPSHPLPVSVP